MGENLRTSFFINSIAISLGNFFSKIIGLFLTIIFSAIIYQFFEKPLTDKRPKEIGV